MNREWKRKMRHDKKLVKELFEIIQKYFPELLDKFANLSDKRNSHYVTYSMKVICVTRLFALLCGLTSMASLTDNFNTQHTIDNISSICNEKLTELPYWETIQDVFININIDELRLIQKYIVKSLIRSKMFDKYKFDGAFQLIFDGTGLSHHDYNLNGNCLSRTTKDGVTTYYKYVLECKLCVGPIVISLDSEFIENEKVNNEKQKQDCETNAFKRMVKRIKKNYPKQKFLITGDALYATSPIISICKKYHWLYIFNLKPDRLKYINDCFEGNIALENETTHKHYYLSTNIEYNKHILHVFKYVQSEGHTYEKNFRYISNILVTSNNIKEIVAIGRKRWKIENEGFYTQKHRTFCITHMCSRNDNALKCHYFFIQFAHTFRQLLEKGHSIVRDLKLKLKEVSVFILDSLTSKSPNLIEINLNFQLRFDD